jgi:small conductance mechanosensitive channel
MNGQDLANQTSAFFKLAMDYLPPILGALIVLFVGRMIANWLHGFVTRALQKTKVDQTLQPVIASVVRYLALGLTILVVLQQFGVQTASLLAILGTIGLAVGLALQGTLSNVAAGLMLLFLRPFEVGNHIEAGGAEGIVLGIDMFHTNLRTTDGVDIVIPNSNILSGTIRNMSNFPERVVSTKLTVALESDPDRAASALREILEGDPLIIKERPRNVALKGLSSGGSEIDISAWVKNEDYVQARTNILNAARKRFAKDDIKLA